MTHFRGHPYTKSVGLAAANAPDPQEDAVARKLIHTRTITVKVYDEGDGKLELEGRLDDEQDPNESGYFSQVRKGDDFLKLGTIHGMTVRYRVDAKTSEIIKSDGEFDVRPHTGCGAVLDWLPKMEGVKIAAGYTQEQRNRFGGPLGCAHMNTLMQVMANTKGASGAYYIPKDKEAARAMVKQRLSEGYVNPAINSCHMWKPDGPILTAMKQGRTAMDHDI